MVVFTPVVILGVSEWLMERRVRVPSAPDSPRFVGLLSVPVQARC